MRKDDEEVKEEKGEVEKKKEGKWVADCPAVSYRFVYLHSRRWEPPISSGTFKTVFQGKKKAAEPIFFAELAFFVHKGDVEVKKGEKTLLEHLFLTVFISFLHLLRNK